MKVEDFDKFKKKGRPKVWKTDDPPLTQEIL